jgi:hypothetical protein
MRFSIFNAQRSGTALQIDSQVYNSTFRLIPKNCASLTDFRGTLYMFETELWR